MNFGKVFKSPAQAILADPTGASKKIIGNDPLSAATLGLPQEIERQNAQKQQQETQTNNESVNSQNQQLNVQLGSATTEIKNLMNTVPLEAKSRTPAGGLRDITTETVKIKARNSGVGGPTDFSDPLASQRGF